MKYLVLLFLIIGCADKPGYRSYTMEINNCTKKRFYYCQRIVPWADDFDVAVCETKDECNAICEKLRLRKDGIKEK